MIERMTEINWASDKRENELREWSPHRLVSEIVTDREWACEKSDFKSKKKERDWMSDRKRTMERSSEWNKKQRGFEVEVFSDEYVKREPTTGKKKSGTRHWKREKLCDKERERERDRIIS